MSKQEILEFLAQHEHGDAFDLAERFAVPYATAAMALLRLNRQGLVERRIDPVGSTYWYRLNTRGRSRLQYFAR